MLTTITRLLPRESVMNPKEIDHEILTVKEISDLLLSVNYFCRSATVIFAGRRQVDV
jgi:hypothetical protein